MWLALVTRRSAFADQLTRIERAKFSRRSAVLATLSAGLVIPVASSRARVANCGARIRRRSVTSDSRLVAEKRRAVPLSIV
jgi:predicted ATPase